MHRRLLAAAAAVVALARPAGTTTWRCSSWLKEIAYAQAHGFSGLTLVSGTEPFARSGL
jgi:hypothetical protein